MPAIDGGEKIACFTGTKILAESEIPRPAPPANRAWILNLVSGGDAFTI